ncbi:MAG: hypothetical protein ACI9C4_000074 [Paraglaciecola sp.]
MIVTKFHRTFFISLLLTLTMATFTVTAKVTELTASVDKNPVLLDESLVLSVTAKGNASRDAFDPSRLDNDFVVGRTSVSSQTQMINFDTTRTTTWNTVLIPRQKGRFTIPSFTIEGQSSQPITLMVLPVSASKNSEARDVFVTTEVDMAEAYLQQQIKYTVKLHLARDLQRGSLSAPTLENGEIRQIGKDAEYADIVDGKRYRIIERTFAVIPQKSGGFVIKGPLFEGEIIQDRQQSFGFFNRSKTISRVGPDQKINILPIPSDFNGSWLPSDYVELSEQWQPVGDKFTVGEPITRTLTLTAVGVIEEQLPEIGSLYPDSVKVYPDQADTATVEKDNVLIAQRKETLAIIPSQAGELQIPPVSVPWFNILTKQIEYAQLPARTIDIGVGAAAKPSPIGTSMPPANNLAQAPEGANGQNDGSQNMGQSGLSNIQPLPSFWSVSSWILLVLWLLTMLAWAWQRRPKAAGEIHPTSNISEKQAWKKLELALTQGKDADITPALVNWLQIILHMPQANLSALQCRINQPQLNTAIDHLFAHRFGRSTEQWNASGLYQTLKSIRDNDWVTHPHAQTLQPLYPKSV